MFRSVTRIWGCYSCLGLLPVFGCALMFGSVAPIWGRYTCFGVFSVLRMSGVSASYGRVLVSRKAGLKFQRHTILVETDSVGILFILCFALTPLTLLKFLSK